MIEPVTGQFEIFEIPTYNLDEVTGGNDEYIYKSSDRVGKLFNNTCIFRYSRQHRVVFDNRSEFKRDFTHFLQDSDIKPIFKKIKIPQDNAPMEWVHQIILNMFVNKNLANEVFDCIYTWVENLAYIVWSKRDSGHRNIQATPGQAIFGR